MYDDGEYEIIDEKEPRTIYPLMMLGRASTVFDGPQLGLSALKIALRFGVVRRNTVKSRDESGKKIR